jgi:hypothetical protein
MTKEEKYIPEFNIQDMLDKVVKKYLPKHHVVFEEPIHEKVNDELWFIYFTSQKKDYVSKYPSKIYHQVVAGFACWDIYYYAVDMIDAKKNLPLSDLKTRFRNHLNMLLRDSEELQESL